MFTVTVTNSLGTLTTNGAVLTVEGFVAPGARRDSATRADAIAVIFAAEPRLGAPWDSAAIGTSRGNATNVSRMG